MYIYFIIYLNLCLEGFKYRILYIGNKLCIYIYNNNNKNNE